MTREEIEKAAEEYAVGRNPNDLAFYLTDFALACCAKQAEEDADRILKEPFAWDAQLEPWEIVTRVREAFAYAIRANSAPNEQIRASTKVKS